MNGLTSPLNHTNLSVKLYFCKMTQGNNILVTVAKLSKFKGEVYPNPRESINS